MEFIDDIARKTGDPVLLVVEAAKAQLASEIGKNCGLFYVPKVINFDKEKGIIDFERLPGLVPLKDLVLRNDPRLFDLLKQAGLALSIIHEKLILPADMKYNLPDDLMDDKDNVFIHGDLTRRNVCFDEPSGRLVIVDWSGAPLFGGTPTFGSRYFDIDWFAYNMFQNIPRRQILSRYGHRIVNAFLEGYASNSTYSISNRIKSAMYHFHKKSIWRITLNRGWPKNMAYFISKMFIYYRWKAYSSKDIFKNIPRSGTR